MQLSVVNIYYKVTVVVIIHQLYEVICGKYCYGVQWGASIVMKSYGVECKSCYGVQCEFCKQEYQHIGKHT